jgi:two-component system, OmpR family, sensor kinase
VSLRARLLLAFAYMLVLVIVALELPLALNLSRRVDAEIKSEAQGQAQLVAAGASGRLDDRAGLDSLVRRSARDLGGRVIVVDAQGDLVADSAQPGRSDAASYASRPEIARALDGRPSQGTRRSESLGEDLLFTAVPVVVKGRRAGAVRVTQSVDAVRREVRNDVIALIGVGVAVLLLGLAVAWFLAGSLAKPLRELASAARRVAGGNLDARAEVEGSTEQKEVAWAFNEMTGRLSATLRAQREFVANASHQLRTPLTGLRLRLEAAELKSREPEVKRELAAAEHETQRLARLLSELLMLAGERERPAPQPVDVGEAAAAACVRWEGPAQRSGHELQVDEGEPAEVAASVEDLAAMLDNLIENALNYSPPGTEVTIGWRADGSSVRIAVADQGAGIDQHERDRVFERFYRGEASRGGAPGTGLGLSVVEALANRWEGEVRIGNRPEGGALAELVLPAHRALPKPDPQLERALPGRG